MLVDTGEQETIVELCGTAEGTPPLHPRFKRQGQVATSSQRGASALQRQVQEGERCPLYGTPPCKRQLDSITPVRRVRAPRRAISVWQVLYPSGFGCGG